MFKILAFNTKENFLFKVMAIIIYNGCLADKD